MISDQFNLDDIDRNIITLLQKHPNITHSEIAKRIGRSQPAVGSRIHRLEEKGVISSQYGINFKNADIILAKVELSTKDPTEMIEMGKFCPFVVNCMRLTQMALSSGGSLRGPGYVPLRQLLRMALST